MLRIKTLSRALTVALFLGHGIPMKAPCCLENGSSFDLASGASPANALAYSPDGSLLAIADVGITLFHVTNNKLSNRTSYALPSGSSGPQALAFSPDGSLLVTANANSSDATLFKVSNGTLTEPISRSLPPAGPPYYTPVGVAFSPDGSLLATVSVYAGIGSGTITVFTVTNDVLSTGTSS